MFSPASKAGFLSYDSGTDGPADRYTVFPYRRLRDADARRLSLGTSDDPHWPGGVSMWGECDPGAHLGRRVAFASLPERVRLHVLERIRESES